MHEETEQTIFLKALEIDVAERRDEFLKIACRGNQSLRGAVNDLLRCHSLPGHVLDTEIAGVSLLSSILRTTEDLDDPAGEAPASALELVGSNVGPYTLLEQIGEGGFGVVFLAVQRRPISRRVALKVIKPGMDTREVIARFEAERQALAMMDHPAIARVLDAGSTPAGRPFFVMELVEGRPVTEFCRQNKLSVRGRIELFIKICEAVHHAHQKGIIHRDLKPSNVLVTHLNAEPFPKVIDFGVAKAIGPRSSEFSLHTGVSHLIGTPLYISPEQAEFAGLDVDTRSDIYSLGVLLYELITGTTPFDRERLRTAPLDEVRRIVREDEPPPPSARLSTSAVLQEAALDRRMEPRKLMGFVRGDLDWIVMKAMEKQRTRRYETVADFAADLRRFLEGKPVEARSPSALYRLRKFAGRNRIALTTFSVVALTLVLGAAVSVWQAIKANQARRDAVEQRTKVENFAANLRAANILIADARDHMDNERWAAAYDDFTKAITLQPDHYPAWSGRGSLYRRLGLWDGAAADYLRSLELGANATGPWTRGLPQLLLLAGHEAEYRSLCAQMRKQTVRADDVNYWSNVVRSCVFASVPVGDAAALLGDAERVLKPSSETRRRWARFGRGDAPPIPPWHHYISGLAYLRLGRFEQAESHLREAADAGRSWKAAAIAYPPLAIAQFKQGRPDAARQTLASADQALDRWIAQWHADPSEAAPIDWLDWIEFLRLHGEAIQVIRGHASPPDARLAAIAQRALDEVHGR